ncbi:hypothetical protein [Paramagnetospirillum kuznetsovii]|uniref:hypothetical protein n=1 Tax=Paramagnetospirillum kuznetsovii TaxID=2053833 RepID=UPI0018646489|nr:hypothetical protein [Paramagnetospirillum kuznetsovii]
MKSPKTDPSRQPSLLDLIANGRLDNNQPAQDALKGILSTRTPERRWRGQSIVPPGSLLDAVVTTFERTTENIHTGLIIIVPGGIPTELQLRLFANALDAIEPMADLVNRIVEAYSDGTVELRDWP